MITQFGVTGMQIICIMNMKFRMKEEAPYKRMLLFFFCWFKAEIRIAFGILLSSSS